MAMDTWFATRKKDPSLANPMNSPRSSVIRDSITTPLVNCYSLLLKMAIEIVDLPMKNNDFPSFLVCLPEAKPCPKFGPWGFQRHGGTPVMVQVLGLWLFVLKQRCWRDPPWNPQPVDLWTSGHPSCVWSTSSQQHDIALSGSSQISDFKGRNQQTSMRSVRYDHEKIRQLQTDSFFSTRNFRARETRSRSLCRRRNSKCAEPNGSEIHGKTKCMVSCPPINPSVACGSVNSVNWFQHVSKQVGSQV